MRVVVTGGHKVVAGSDAHNDLHMRIVRLRAEVEDERDLYIAHGGATGIDELTQQQIDNWRLKHEVFRPNTMERVIGKWGLFLRNGRMLRSFRPELVIAIRKGAGNGTRNCASQAAAMGIKVEWV